MCAVAGCHYEPQLEILDDPEVKVIRRVEDWRARFGDAYELEPGERATWRFGRSDQRRKLLVFSQDRHEAAYLVDGKALPSQVLVPGWNPVSNVGRAAVTLELVADRPMRVDAAAMVARGEWLETAERETAAKELVALEAEENARWSVELAARNAYPDGAIEGLSKTIPESDVCPSWRLPGTADDVLKTLWSQRFAARGYVFDARQWNATTLACKQKDGLDLAACLSCSTALPAFVAKEGMVPVGVYHRLWCSPFAGAACGTCLKIRLPEGEDSPRCTYDSTPLLSHCPAIGKSYRRFLAERGAFDVRVHVDEDGEYILGYVQEWFDNIAGPMRSHPMSIDFQTHTGHADGVVDFPVEYELTQCPTDGPLGYVMMDLPHADGWLAWLKLRIVDNVTPIERVEVQQLGAREDATPVADGYWEILRPLPRDRQIRVRTTLFDPGGTPRVIEASFRPDDALCAYQDPQCRPLRR